MASSTQKKTTTKKSGSRSGSRTAKGKQPQKRPIRREVGGVILLVLALCVLVSYCGVQAILIDLLAKLLKGLFGYGYWLAGPAMLLAGGILLLHRGRPVTLRATCALLLPLLLDFGLLEFVGALLTKIMRPLFKVPGRAAVDCITSWIGDGTLGVMLTCNQYEGGYYSAKEASIIATLFSAVSITFTLVVLETVGMLDKFGIYYLIVCFVGIVCAIICPYLYPLRKKPNTYLVEGKAAPDTLPEGYKSNVEYGMDLAMKRVAEHKGIGEFFKSGAKNACSMWFGVLPSVMAIGTIALILANYTPIFEWLGIPFRPLLQLLQVPEADAVASTMIVGFTDMLTPAILIAECTSEMARFIVAVVSVTQVLYLSEVGGLILGSKLPLNIWELFVIFLERTIISLLIVCPIAHLLF